MNSFLPKFRKWELEHPIAAAFVVMLLFSFFRKGLYLIFIQLPNTKGLWFVHQFLDLLWPVGMVMLFGLTSIYRKGDFLDTLLAGQVVLLVSIVILLNNIFSVIQTPGFAWYPFPMMLVGILTMMAVGFREESVFRGISVNLLAQKYLKDRNGVLFTVWCSAFFFGFSHMTNMILGQSFSASLLQSIHAVFLGAVFAAIYLRGGNIWAVTFLHGFYDLSASAPQYLTKTYGNVMQILIPLEEARTMDAGHVIAYFILFSTYTLITMYLLRKPKCDAIIERYKKDPVQISTVPKQPRFKPFAFLMTDEAEEEKEEEKEEE